MLANSGFVMSGITMASTNVWRSFSERATTSGR